MSWKIADILTKGAALEPLVYLRADMKVARRRLRNLRKGLGDTTEAPSAA
jgi:hypothetical protein